jgi:hypothetical protein
VRGAVGNRLLPDAGQVEAHLPLPLLPQHSFIQDALERDGAEQPAQLVACQFGLAFGVDDAPLIVHDADDFELHWPCGRRPV